MSWNTQIDGWMNGNRMFYVFTNHGYLIEVHFDYWVSSESVWIPLRRAFFTYDTNGNLISAFEEDFHKDGYWIKIYFISFLVDEGGNPIEEI